MPHHYPLLPLPQNAYPTLISQPAVTPHRRKTPCEPCRDKKRRCDFAKPSCSRCICLESTCIYTEPVDSAVAKQRANFMTGTLLAMELEDLDDKMDTFEHDISQVLKDAENSLLTHNTAPLPIFLKLPQGLPKNEDTISVMRAVKVKKRRNLPSYSFSLANSSSTASLSLLPSKVSWRIQLSRKGFRIETNIQHYSDFVQFMANGLTSANILRDSTTPVTILTPHHSDDGQLYNEHLGNLYLYKGKLWSYIEEDPSKRIADDYRKKLALNLHSWQDEISQTENQWLLRNRNRYNMDDFNAEELEEIYYINSEDNSSVTTAKFSISPRGRWDDIIDHYLSCYFTCLNNDIPYIDERTVRERWFFPEKRDKSILMYALAAATAGRECRHIKLPPSHLSDLIPTYASSLFEAFALHAHRLLRGRFDTEDLETFLALISMATYAMIHFKVVRAGIYRSMLLRLGNALLSHYFIDVNQSNPQACPIEIEMFKRAYWLNLHIDMAFQFLGGQTSIYTTIQFPFAIDDFKPFPIELESAHRGLLLTQFICSARIVELSKFIFHELGRPNPTSKIISEQFITDIEHQLMHIWHLTSSKVKLPLDGTDKIQVEDVPNQAALRMTIIYHGVWMGLHEHFLPKDEEPPNRSLAICTHAAHVISHLYNLLAYVYNPCHTDTHTLFKACNIHYRNIHSPVPEVRIRARMSLRQSIQTIRYVHGQIESDGTENFFDIHRESWEAFERGVHAITIEDSENEKDRINT